MKRAFDLTVSAFALMVSAPLFGAIALAVFLDDGSPVIFEQKRVGRGNQLFKIRKFRTMRNGMRSAPSRETAGKDCYTRIGRFLRRMSLDELPQLVNIFEGTMSFVGPRPLIPEENAIRQLREEAGVYAVLPGLTGWAQVNGRAKCSDTEKVALDAEYIKNQSMPLDIKILFKTVLQVLTRKDVE
ncbi:MAG: sugar transferase [Oscillospiraceae bacterium]|jgi:O-antigen biosynthesis protein WbqP|nr:sugar transferase [Oscillospiraceae bacterium]